MAAESAKQSACAAEGRGRTGQGDDDARQRRTDDANHAARHLRGGERRHQQVRWRHHRDGGQFRRAGKGVADGDQHGQNAYLPHLAGKGHQRHQDHAGQVADDHQALAVQAVGDDAGDRGQDDARDQLQDIDEAQQHGRASHGEGEQGQRHQRHGLPQLRDDLGQPETAEGGDSQDVAQAAPGVDIRGFVVGDGGVSAG